MATNPKTRTDQAIIGNLSASIPTPVSIMACVPGARMRGFNRKVWETIGLRVLLIDDEENLRRMLRVILLRRGFDVTDCSRSAEALAWSEANEVDVLVTDVTLGDTDGIALAESIVKRHPEAMVVFISGYPVDIEAEQRKHPYCAHLMKPFPPQALPRAIEALAEQRRQGGGG